MLYRNRKDKFIGLFDGRIPYNMNVTTNVFDGQWHKIKLTWDRGQKNFNLYIDGALEGSAKISSDKPGIDGTDFYLGNANVGSRPIGGIIDELVISSSPK